MYNRVMRSGQCGPEHVQRLEEARDRLQDANERLSVWSPPTATVDQIRARAKHVQAMHELDFLVVDYVGLVQSKDRRLKKWEHISEVSRELKGIAEELSVPVLALAQLNREADGQEPRLSQLRDSSALEQDADRVIFLHADRKAKKTWDYSRDVQSIPEERRTLYKNEVRLIVAKHRHGEAM